MSNLYLRKAELSLQNIKTRRELVIKDLRVSFSIDKTSESTANSSTIKVYNLNETSRAFCEAANLQVILKVGYESFIETIFKGKTAEPNLGKTFSERKVPDWITQIEAGDGLQELKQKKVSKSYKQGTSLGLIVQDVIGAFDLARGSQDIPSLGSLVGSMTVSDSAKNVLDKLAERLGFEWSSQGEAIQVTKPGQVTKEPAVVVSPSSGLISNIQKTDTGIKFRCLILPQLVPGRACKIVGADNAQGLYKVRKALFNGDTKQGDWYVDVEAEVIK